MRVLFGLLLCTFVFTISNNPCIALQSKQNRAIFTKMDPAPNIVPTQFLGCNSSFGNEPVDKTDTW